MFSIRTFRRTSGLARQRWPWISPSRGPAHLESRNGPGFFGGDDTCFLEDWHFIHMGGCGGADSSSIMYRIQYKICVSTYTDLAGRFFDDEGYTVCLFCSMRMRSERWWDSSSVSGYTTNATKFRPWNAPKNYWALGPHRCSFAKKSITCWTLPGFVWRGW